MVSQGTSVQELARLRRMERREAAGEAKKQNIRLIGVLLGSGAMTPGDGASWYTAIDRTRSLVAQQTLGETLQYWATMVSHKKRVGEEIADLQRQTEQYQAQTAETKRRTEEAGAARRGSPG